MSRPVTEVAIRMQYGFDGSLMGDGQYILHVCVILYGKLVKDVIKLQIACGHFIW